MTQIRPQLAESTPVDTLPRFINDPNWVFEQKLDGDRILLMSPGRDMPPTAITRNGTLYTKKIPKDVLDFRFPPGEWMLDGELVRKTVAGHTVSATLHVFDLPHAAGILPLNASLHVRRAALETLFASIKHPFKLVPQARTPQEKADLAAEAIRRNLEGLVVKRVDSPYRSGGRTPEWLKAKFVSTADCVVLDVRDDGKDSVRLGAYDDAGVLVDVGRASLIGKEKKAVINKGDVLEVRYLYTGANGRLYQPTILKRRDDKRPDECRTSQLKHVNKEVLETL